MNCEPLTYKVGQVTIVCNMSSFQTLLWSLEFVIHKTSRAEHRQVAWFYICAVRPFQSKRNDYLSWIFAQLKLVRGWEKIKKFSRWTTRDPNKWYWGKVMVKTLWLNFMFSKYEWHVYLVFILLLPLIFIFQVWIMISLYFL